MRHFLFLVLLTFLSTSASAALITITTSGKVSGITETFIDAGDVNALNSLGSISVGDDFYLSYTFDTNAPDDDDSEMAGRYVSTTSQSNVGGFSNQDIVDISGSELDTRAFLSTGFSSVPFSVPTDFYVSGGFIQLMYQFGPQQLSSDALAELFSVIKDVVPTINMGFTMQQDVAPFETIEYDFAFDIQSYTFDGVELIEQPNPEPVPEPFALGLLGVLLILLTRLKKR